MNRGTSPLTVAAAASTCRSRCGPRPAPARPPRPRRSTRRGSAAGARRSGSVTSSTRSCGPAHRRPLVAPAPGPRPDRRWRDERGHSADEHRHQRQHGQRRRRGAGRGTRRRGASDAATALSTAHGDAGAGGQPLREPPAIGPVARAAAPGARRPRTRPRPATTPPPSIGHASSPGRGRVEEARRCPRTARRSPPTSSVPVIRRCRAPSAPVRP